MVGVRTVVGDARGQEVRRWRKTSYGPLCGRDADEDWPWQRRKSRFSRSSLHRADHHQ